jgi:hypothetical protein
MPCRSRRGRSPGSTSNVPELYLEGFVGRKGQCFAVDAERRRPFKSKPAGIAVQRDFNLIEVDGVPPDALERTTQSRLSLSGIQLLMCLPLRA